MDANLKAKWVEALRSGNYQQYRNGVGNKRAKHLYCLGVGACVIEPSTEIPTTMEAVEVLSRNGFAGAFEPEGGFSELTHTLIEMNDINDKSFAEIADYIEANL